MAQFPSLRTPLLPFPSPPSSANIWKSSAIKAGCREPEVPKQNNSGLVNGLIPSIKFSWDTVLCPDLSWIKAALPAPGGTAVLELAVSWHRHPALLPPILCFWLQLVSGCLDRQTELVQLSR